jgi:hypothetical protein
MKASSCIHAHTGCAAAFYSASLHRGIAVVLCLSVVPLAPKIANAGYSVEIGVDGGPPITYLDNGAFDLNPAPFDIQIDFQVGDAGGFWTAEGTVFATGGNGAPPVSTIVTDTLIEKQLPGLFFGSIQVTHNYSASGLGSHSALLDGQFENTLGVPISYAELFYTPTVNGQGMGSAHEGPVINMLGPVPFNDVLGPLVLGTTTEHHINIGFYLDSPGDAIRLFDSAELHTFVPEPASAALLAATLLIRRRRRAPAHGPLGQSAGTR